jgi:predicted ATPase
VWFADLAPLGDPTLVAVTVASVLGVREEPGRPVLDTLVAAVGGRSLLVLLDNCEHLIGACPKLADALLRGCPNLALLATSREAAQRYADLVIKPRAEGVGLLEFHQLDAAREAGRRAARQALERAPASLVA